MSKAIEIDPEAPFVLDDATGTELTSEPSASLDDGEDYGFYVAKNWFARKKFPIFPHKGYKPVYLDALNDGLWYEFNRDVQHYQKYYAHISWYYKLWIVAPTCWFLVMILPDLLWYYDIVFRGVGIIIGLLLALTFSLDTYLQRRLLTLKVQPMYELLIDTYKSRFMMHGYLIYFKTEHTGWDGMNLYIQFRRARPGYSEKPSESLHAGFYMDEDFLGSKPYTLEMTSRVAPPRFLTGVDTSTWTTFARDLEVATTTPPKYLLGYTIGMGFVMTVAVGAIIYAVVVFSALRHWVLIVLFPMYALADLMRSFRRRHFVENVMIHNVNVLLKEYEPKFLVAGYRGFFEMEYMLSYLCVNTYMTFKKATVEYEVPSKPGMDISTTTV